MLGTKQGPGPGVQQRPVRAPGTPSMLATPWPVGHSRSEDQSPAEVSCVRPCLVHPKIKKFSRFSITSNLATHA